MNENNDLPEGAGENGALTSKEDFGRRPYRFRPKGNVYFIRAGDKIKIGYSARPLDRLKALQTSHPGKLELIGTRPGSREFETELHDHFAALHVRGEWFEAKEPLLRYIEEITPEGKAAASARRRAVVDSRVPAAVLSEEAKTMIARLIIVRSEHGADTAMGHACSNLAEQIKAMAGYVRPAWATHDCQTLPWMMERQMKRIEQLRHGFQ